MVTRKVKRSARRVKNQAARSVNTAANVVRTAIGAPKKAIMTKTRTRMGDAGPQRMKTRNAVGEAIKRVNAAGEVAEEARQSAARRKVRGSGKKK